MARAKKTPIFQYGIEITNPHSTLMYDHNDTVADIMKININNVATSIWNDLVYSNEAVSLADWTTFKDATYKSFTIEDFQKTICYSGFGDGFTMLDVFNEIQTAVEDSENWRMHELYQEMHEAGMVPTIKWELLGFKNNYNKDYPTYAAHKDADGGEYTSPVLEDQLVDGLTSQNS